MVISSNSPETVPKSSRASFRRLHSFWLLREILARYVGMYSPSGSWDGRIGSYVRRGRDRTGAAAKGGPLKEGLLKEGPPREAPLREGSLREGPLKSGLRARVKSSSSRDSSVIDLSMSSLFRLLPLIAESSAKLMRVALYCSTISLKRRNSMGSNRTSSCA